MRKLLALVLIAAVVWGGYWFVGASAVERGLTAWFDQRRAQGWVADYADLNTTGFPNRFDTTITGLELADPNTGVAWSAPLFQILALSYKPHHIIAVLPNTQTLASPLERVDIASDRMRGSVVFKPGTSLTLDHATFVMDNVTLTGGAGWSMALETGRFATRQTAARQYAHDIAFEALGFAPTATTRARLDPATLLPDTVETLKIDATVGFDAPWDRFAVENARPNITAIDLNLLRATWGTLDFRAAGGLTVDDQGVPTGRITIKATNWREMLEMAVAGGLLPGALAPTVERGLGMLAGLSGNPETLDAPLSFQNGFVSFGPIPLGPAPRLRLR
ncbi:DUF2125 domain-containing protein [Oceaniglobus ichthyenteri]|uniref:DUF2125 domain-containing protein n=1 Tax=Oceaniglobus ichthyenteri TaxID=2136177 RepID=UPI000D388C36|nr:DUF2125 domain-containing protein [Oceaniglobus ichthyenteri]